MKQFLRKITLEHVIQPYSIVTLEGVIDELKKEKAELCRKNEALRENNNNMKQTISQLSQTNKQLEEEKSSLVTAIKIIQKDFNQQAISKKKSGEAREETGGGINDKPW
jgi:predicted nuclease with TOPRIM domain